jgi:uncharacterized integral membrane protein
MLLFRIVGMLVYALLTIVILAFIFSNREAVSIDLFPFGTAAELPLYIALSALFALGLLIGLLHSATLWLSMRRKLARAQRAISQLEKERAATSV